MKTRTGLAEDGHTGPEYRRLFGTTIADKFRSYLHHQGQVVNLHGDQLPCYAGGCGMDCLQSAECTAACSGKTAITGEEK